MQLPLPKHISHSRILQAIDVNKDVDGFKTENIGRLHLGEEGFNPCTPEGVIALLKNMILRSQVKMLRLLEEAILWESQCLDFLSIIMQR
ncbi:hypothetical protein HMPREF9466_02731 [Fusobacterium necrophorum subsp. funduliforme 1_1_36S]|nr:hypothetical protein HMPREF9466_02731 [Fusobacterium necrophorum subsp. funduliforme 1_1_36S]